MKTKLSENKIDATSIKQLKKAFNLSIEDKKTAIRFGANEVLPAVIYNNHVEKYLNWCHAAEEKNKIETSQKWFNAYVQELLKECKEPKRQNDLSENQLSSLDNCNTEPELKAFLTEIDVNSIEVKEPTEAKTKHYSELINRFKTDFTKRMQEHSRKRDFGYQDAKGFKKHHTNEDSIWINLIDFIEKPIRNQYYIYCIHYYNTGQKLPEKMFSHDLDKLQEYYNKIDQAKSKDEPFIFNPNIYYKYVIYMTLKMSGFYKNEYDQFFDVKDKSNEAGGHAREYNPACYVPSVLRGELPIQIKEYDISRAHPNFIAEKYGLQLPDDVYKVVTKKEFATAINSHSQTKVKFEDCIKTLKKVFGSEADKVLTLDKYNQKGALFRELCEMEADYINQFIKANTSPENAFQFVRLHDGVLMPKDTEIKTTDFGKITFKEKECVKPPKIKNVVSFYNVSGNEIQTSVTSYRDFLQSENFIRVYSNDDKIEVIKNENNIVDFYNHSTEIIKYLENHICEYELKNKLTEQITKDRPIIQNSLLLLPNLKLKYYKDSPESFGLLFKNGFFKITKDNPQPTLEPVKDFFAPHKTHEHTFTPLSDKTSIFELFIQRISTGKKEDFSKEDLSIFQAFCSMIGYMCHNYKSQVLSPAVILSDHDANGVNRNGGRGKSLITKGLEYVQKSLFKGAGSEFNPSYQFNWDDLDRSHNVYIVDDVGYNFKYDDLYTNILGGISAHRKGKKAETITFEESPKFIITTNWVVLYDENNTSTNRRFFEYKLTDYYNKDRTPADEFKGVFFASWDADEWNRFYTFIFECVYAYLNNSIQKIAYDKDQDNFKSYFQNDVMFSEFQRIFTEIEKSGKADFNVSDFLNIYNHYENPLKNEKLFHKNNVKKLIDLWIKQEKLYSKIDYSSMARKWIFKSNF
jgi:hypothetical protein